MYPTFNDIYYFCEVANTKNISRAALNLGVTQPTISTAIKKLEDQIGESLLIRTKKGITLTRAGKEVIKKSKTLFHCWDEIQIHAKDSMREVQGQIKIGCHSSVGLYTLPNFIPSLLDKYPELNIELNHDLSRRITDKVIGLELDIGIVVNPLKHPDLILIKLCEDEVSLWTKNKPSKLQDISSKNSILIYDSSLLQSQSLIKKMNKKIKFERKINTTSLENIALLVDQGSGIGIIPNRIIENLKLKNVKKLNSSPIFKDEIYAVIRVENKNVTAISQTLKHIQNSIK